MAHYYITSLPPPQDRTQVVLVNGQTIKGQEKDNYIKYMKESIFNFERLCSLASLINLVFDVLERLTECSSVCIAG